MFSLRERNFVLALYWNSREEEIANRNSKFSSVDITKMQVDLFTKLLLKRKKEKTQTNKQTNNQTKNQDTIIKFIKILLKFVCENHTDEITYVRFVAHNSNETHRYRKSLSNCSMQQKN